MDFSIDGDQEALLASVDALMHSMLPADEVLRRDRLHQPPYDLLPGIASLGVLGLPFPTRYGGGGGDWLTLTLAQERLAYHAYFVASIVSRVVTFGGMPLLAYGTEEQREQWLPALISGRALFALALTEPGAGSDVGRIRTSASRTTSGWVIAGEKLWVSDADAATHLMVPVRTDPYSAGTQGLSILLVPRDSAGLQMTALPKVGNNCMPSYAVHFDQTEVGGEALMGTEGAGASHVLSTLHYSRSSMAASLTGCSQAVVDLAASHARERWQFGRPIGKNQAVRHRLADMQMRVDQSSLVFRHLAWMIDSKRPSRRQAAQAKVLASETLQFVTRSGMQILASSGYSTESHMQRMWRDAGLYSFGEGTNEIQRDVIAREMGL